MPWDGTERVTYICPLIQRAENAHCKGTHCLLERKLERLCYMDACPSMEEQSSLKGRVPRPAYSDRTARARG